MEEDIRNRFTQLEMDEVAIWNRPLSIDEIRQWRHLTKSIAGDPIFKWIGVLSSVQ